MHNVMDKARALIREYQMVNGRDPDCLIMGSRTYQQWLECPNVDTGFRGAENQRISPFVESVPLMVMDGLHIGMRAGKLGGV